MTRTRTAPTPPAEPKTHRSARPAVKKPVRVPAAPAPIPEFDAAAHREEIAQVAYRNWLERAAVSPEEDWRRAEIEVRAKYTE
jgi:hypothetical protein